VDGSGSDRHDNDEKQPIRSILETIAGVQPTDALQSKEITGASLTQLEGRVLEHTGKYLSKERL